MILNELDPEMGPVVGTIFDSDKACMKPSNGYSSMSFEEFEQYVSAFYFYVNYFFTTDLEINRIERTFRISVKRYARDLVSEQLFDLHSHNMLKIEYFNILLNQYFHLFDEKTSERVYNVFKDLRNHTGYTPGYTELKNDIGYILEYYKETHPCEVVTEDYNTNVVSKKITDISILEDLQKLLNGFYA